MKKLITTILYLAAIASFATAADPVKSVRTDNQSPQFNKFNVTVSQAENAIVRAYLYNNGVAWNPGTNYTATMGYGTNRENSTAMLLVTGVVSSASNFVDFSWTANDLNTNGNFFSEIMFVNNTNSSKFVLGVGTMTIAKSTITGGGSLSAFYTSIDFSLATFSNTTNGPYIAGSNVIFRPVGSRGQVLVDAVASSITGGLASVSYVDSHTGLQANAHGGVVLQSTTGGLGVAYSVNSATAENARVWYNSTAGYYFYAPPTVASEGYVIARSSAPESSGYVGTVMTNWIKHAQYASVAASATSAATAAYATTAGDASTASYANTAGSAYRIDDWLNMFGLYITNASTIYCGTGSFERVDATVGFFGDGSGITGIPYASVANNSTNLGGLAASLYVTNGQSFVSFGTVTNERSVASSSAGLSVVSVGGSTCVVFGAGSSPCAMFNDGVSFAGLLNAQGNNITNVNTASISNAFKISTNATVAGNEYVTDDEVDIKLSLFNGFSWYGSTNIAAAPYSTFLLFASNPVTAWTHTYTLTNAAEQLVGSRIWTNSTVSILPAGEYIHHVNANYSVVNPTAGSVAYRSDLVLYDGASTQMLVAGGSAQILQGISEVDSSCVLLSNVTLSASQRVAVLRYATFTRTAGSGTATLNIYGGTGHGGVPATRNTRLVGPTLNASLSDHILRNGSVTYTGNQSFGGYSATNLGNVQSISITGTSVSVNTITGGTARINGNTVISSGTLAISNAVTSPQLRIAYDDTYYSTINWKGSPDVYQNPWSVYIAGAEKLTVDTSGNVGIGTNVPGAKLHVAGDVMIGGVARTNWPGFIGVDAGSSFQYSLSLTFTNDGALHNWALPSGIPSNATAYLVYAQIAGGTASVDLFFSQSSGFTSGTKSRGMWWSTGAGTYQEYCQSVPHPGTNCALQYYGSSGLTVMNASIIGYQK